MNIKEKEMQELIKKLNYHTKLYDEGKPELTDKEWDDMYFALAALEKETGIYMPNSPTQKINYEIMTELKKVNHNHPMLSLEKTKSVDTVENFVGKKNYVAMAKMDGLTCSLQYENGELVRAETRGDGISGDDITHNAIVIPSIPKKINYLESLTVDGEIISTRENFKKFESEYKNARNFAAGSIRLLDAKECAGRGLSFVAWDVIGEMSGIETDTLSARLKKLNELNFKVVPYKNSFNIEKDIEELTKDSENLSYPIDGIVFKYDDRDYYNSLGSTDHHFRGGLAFKFEDEIYETTLVDIDWTMGRTGVLTPVAVFNPVEIEGSVVERCSLFNLSILEEKLGNPYVGQKLWISKRNMIIPYIEKADKNTSELPKEKMLYVPTQCHICGSQLIIKKDNESEFLCCIEENCDGKLVNRLDHFCSKKGLDIKGLSKATLAKLVDWGWLNNIVDIYNLSNYRTEWVVKPGFGQKSVDNILNAIEEKRITYFVDFIAAIGIPLIGKSVAKELNKYFDSYDEFKIAIDNNFSFWELPNFGEAKHQAIVNYDYTYADELVKNKIVIINNLEDCDDEEDGNSLYNLTFVITGKLKSFKNRDELKDSIIKHGGKVGSSITSKTDYLINNDITSTSSKNAAAKKANIPIISEEQYLKMIAK